MIAAKTREESQINLGWYKKGGRGGGVFLVFIPPAKKRFYRPVRAESRHVKKHPKKHIYKKQQNQNQPAIS